ncbi:unnamed protein product [Gongylonema pulchrum]|uniref:PITH domain-containing protein n=1 Tax=Gongylonema pulchrum TaxID=637853 RepID=A0A183ELN2_9BILA|nr:unnamed protein product [Gongylonema pulchrum]
MNENCGKIREVHANPVDLAIENVQDSDACGLRIRTGGSGHSRSSLLWDGWKRCKTRQLSLSPDSSFYQNDLLVKSATVKFNNLPDTVKKMTIFGNEYDIDDALNTKIVFESTDKSVNMYLPSALRVL